MKWQVLWLELTTLAAASSIYILVWKVDPNDASKIIKSLFFVTLFLLTWGIFSNIILLIKNVGDRILRPENTFYSSLFQGLISSIVLVIVIVSYKMGLW